MKKLEWFFTSFAVIALILNFLHISFGALILLLAFIGLAGFYIFHVCKNKDDRKILGIINSVALSLLIIGALFKTLYWLFASYILSIGFVSLLIVSIFYLKNAKQNKLALIRNGIVFLFWVLIYAL
jgi:hypothetical protein